MKILVIGFQRSGTTLLRRLLEFHPDIKIMLHETRFLKSKKKQTNKQIVDYLINYKVKNQIYTGKDPITETWGEKVPWAGNGRDIISYSNRWVAKFGEEACIIHIVRHPMDVALSNHRKTNANIRAVIKNYSESVPRVIENIDSLLIKFEDLVIHPKKILKRIFNYCQVNSEEKILNKIVKADKKQLRYFNSINKSRAFAYKKDPLSSKFEIPDYDKIIRKGKNDYNSS